MKLRLSALILLIVMFMSACGNHNGDTGKENVNDNEFLYPDYVMENAFASTEDSFFSDFNVDKSAAEFQTITMAQSEDEINIYVLKESCNINNYMPEIHVEFKDGQWQGIVYEIVLLNENPLRDAYDFVYRYIEGYNM